MVLNKRRDVENGARITARTRTGDAVSQRVVRSCPVDFASWWLAVTSGSSMKGDLNFGEAMGRPLRRPLSGEVPARE